MAKTLPLDITLQPNCSTKFICTCHAYRHHWLPPFHTTFTDLDLTWGSQSQCEAKAIGFIFSHTFYLIEIKFDVMMKQSKLNILTLLFSKICWNKGNNCCFTDCMKKIGMHIEVYKSVWFKLECRYYCTLHFEISMIDLDLDSRSQECIQIFTDWFPSNLVGW